MTRIQKMLFFLLTAFLLLLFLYKLNRSTQQPSVLEQNKDRKVLVVIFNPNISNQKLIAEKKWNAPSDLIKKFVEDITLVSKGRLNYQVIELLEINQFPIKEDGFKYSQKVYLTCLSDPKKCHEKDTLDYKVLFDQFEVCKKVNRNELDEVWLFGGPYFGFYESRLAGPKAFFYNSPPLLATNCQKLVPVMGFNYERSVSEMLESFGHRVEFTLTKVFENAKVNDWERFTRYDQKFPGKAECGTVHFAPNSTRDYDWSNSNYALSNCDSWYSFPEVTHKPELINCQKWGCQGYDYKKYWLALIPIAAGETKGIKNDWWSYISNPNLIGK
ncbi:MAG: hypothetical protein AAB443_00420 [Patescibacteria group bacterium]